MPTTAVFTAESTKTMIAACDSPDQTTIAEKSDPFGRKYCGVSTRTEITPPRETVAAPQVRAKRTTQPSRHVSKRQISSAQLQLRTAQLTSWRVSMISLCGNLTRAESPGSSSMSNRNSCPSTRFTCRPPRAKEGQGQQTGGRGALAPCPEL